MRIVAISDTHGFHDALTLPEGDLLVHAGDWSRRGSEEESRAFLAWLGRQPHRDKVLVAGNHDWFFQREPAAARALIPPGVTWLQDEGATLGGVRLWGSPWTPEFCQWAFMLPRGGALRARWERIPTGTDVLITHGPPYGHGDAARLTERLPPRAVGCLELLLAVRRVRPRLHVFGHIHEGHGTSRSDELQDTVFLNAAVCTVDYEPLNPPLVVDL